MPEGKKQANGRVSPADWIGARDEYVTTGTMSYADVGRMLGVTRKAVEKHALNRDANGGRTWAEWRDEFQDEVTGRSHEIQKRIKVEASAKVSIRHAELLQELALQAGVAVKDVFAKLAEADKIKLALAVISTERRVHGLDRAPVQPIELTGKDGEPIDFELGIEHDLDDATRTLGERMLEVVFGKAKPAHKK